MIPGFPERELSPGSALNAESRFVFFRVQICVFRVQKCVLWISPKTRMVEPKTAHFPRARVRGKYIYYSLTYRTSFNVYYILSVWIAHPGDRSLRFRPPHVDNPENSPSAKSPHVRGKVSEGGTTIKT